MAGRADRRCRPRRARSPGLPRSSAGGTAPGGRWTRARSAFLHDRGFTTWNADSGWLRPFDHRFTQIRPDANIWVRADARSPWVLDVPLTPFRDGRWMNKKVPGHTMALEDATWVADDGLRYLNPEIVLLMKAAQTRAKDVRDAEQALPLLDQRQRGWLRATVAALDPAHPWTRLS